jgi:hypothetical protein
MGAQRKVEGVYGGPSFHMVGDGFRVMGYFSVVPDAVRKLSPFLMLDYGAPYDYPPTENTRRGVGREPRRALLDEGAARP